MVCGQNFYWTLHKNIFFSKFVFAILIEYSNLRTVKADCHEQNKSKVRRLCFGYNLFVWMNKIVNKLWRDRHMLTTEVLVSSVSCPHPSFQKITREIVLIWGSVGSIVTLYSPFLASKWTGFKRLIENAIAILVQEAAIFAEVDHFSLCPKFTQWKLCAHRPSASILMVGYSKGLALHL